MIKSRLRAGGGYSNGRTHVLKPWHKEDTFNALATRGWDGPKPLAYPGDWHYVGEAWCFSRGHRTLNMYFVGDYGTGFHGKESIESIAALLLDGDHERECDLWLHRTRDAKWRASVIEWAEQVSADQQ